MSRNYWCKKSYQVATDSMQDFIDRHYVNKKGHYLTLTEIWYDYKSEGNKILRKDFKDKIKNKMGGLVIDKPRLDIIYLKIEMKKYHLNAK